MTNHRDAEILGFPPTATAEILAKYINADVRARLRDESELTARELERFLTGRWGISCWSAHRVNVALGHRCFPVNLAAQIVEPTPEYLMLG